MKRTNTLLALLITVGLFSLAAGSAYSRQAAASNNHAFQDSTRKMGPELQSALDSGTRGTVSVNIVLVHQPLHEVSKAVKEKNEKEIEVSKSRIKSIVEGARKREGGDKGVMALSWADEKEIDVYGALTAAEKGEIEFENERLKDVKRRAVKETIDTTKTLIRPAQKRVRRAVEAAGGTVTYEGSFVNIVSATVPVDELPAIAAMPEVAFIEKSQTYHALLDTATGSVYAQTFWNAGYNGSPYAVAVVDTGVDSSHPALTSRVIDNKTFVSTGVDSTTSDDLYGHGTHVAGIVASTDSTYRGVAPGAWIINAKAGNSSGSLEDSWVMSAIDWAIYNATSGADVVSASFGSSGRDYPFEKFFDALVDDLGIFASVAAGNSGPDSGTIDTPGATYNVMTVGAMDDQDTTSRSDDSIAYYSGRGPVTADMVKPDIVAPGGDNAAHPILSASNTWETGPDFIAGSGTSMATPMVSGAAALLMSAGVTNPLEIKALLLNTAEDRGTAGPDNSYGWGYMDLNHTFYHTSDVRLGEVNNTVKKLYYVGPTLSGDKATIAWNRRSVYNGPSYPTDYNIFVSDLDLYLYSESNGTELDNSTMQYSNVEQVVSPTNDTVVIKIHAFSLQRSPETFALATEEGFTLTSLPEIAVNISQLNTSYVNNSFQIEVNASNKGTIAIHNVNVTLSLPIGVSLASGTNPVSLGTISAGSSKTATFTLTANTTGNKTINATVNSSSYGEVISTASSISIEVLDTTPPNIKLYSPQNVTYNITTVDLNYSVTDVDGVSWVGYSLDGASNMTLSGNTTLTVQTEGQHSITVWANDTAGNFNTTTVYFSLNFTLGSYSNSSVTVNANQTTTINATNVNVTLDIVTSQDAAGSINMTLTSVNQSGTNAMSVPALGRYLQINASPSISGNLTWAMLKMYYADEEVTNVGLTEEYLDMYWWNDTSSEWMRLNDSMDWVYGAGVNTSANYVWANVSHFSHYALGVPQLPSWVNLSDGWNMFGVPVDIANYSLPNALSSISGSYDWVFYFNATTDAWQFYNPGMPQFSDLKELEPGRGYFIQMTGNTTLNFTGTLLTGLTVPLEVDWNMFAPPLGLSNYTLPAPLTSISGSYDWVFYFNATTDAWQFYNPSMPQFSDLKTLEAGRGYFIQMNTNATWTL